jgi:hypothetical protein
VSHEAGGLGDAVKANNVSAIRDLLVEAVSGYAPSSGIVDWVHLQQAGHNLAQPESTLQAASTAQAA